MARYCVVLKGAYAEGAVPTDVNRRLAAMTAQSESVVGRLFSGAPRVLKRGLEHDQAERIAAALRGIGAPATAEEEVAPLTIDLDPELLAEVNPDRPPATPVASVTEPRTDAPDPTREALYRAFVGPKHTDYYLRYFARRDAGGGFLSWNWPSAFAVFWWALYRRCYGFAFGGWFAAFALATCGGFLYGFAHGMVRPPDRDSLPWGGSVVGIVAAMLVGLIANGFYYRKAQRVLAETSTIADPTLRLALVAERGGVQPAWAWAGAICAVAVVLLGVAAAIAFPAYIESQQRQRAAEQAPAPAPVPPVVRADPEPAPTALPQTQWNPADVYGNWRCTNQDTGNINYWQFVAGGAMYLYGENNPALGAAPIVSPNAPSRWRLQNGQMIWEFPQLGNGSRAILIPVTLSPTVFDFVSSAGDRVHCRRP